MNHELVYVLWHLWMFTLVNILLIFLFGPSTIIDLIVALAAYTAGMVFSKWAFAETREENE